MTFWRAVGAIIVGGLVLLLLSGLLTEWQLGRYVAQLKNVLTSGQADRDDATCLKAEAGMRMLPKPAAHAVRGRNPNTGNCAWIYR